MDEIDKGNKSKWKFYFDFLPSNYDNFPIFYKEKISKNKLVNKNFFHNPSTDLLWNFNFAIMQIAVYLSKNNFFNINILLYFFEIFTMF